MNKYFESEGIRITDEPGFMGKEHAVTEEVGIWINKMHIDVVKKKPGTADRLLKLINKHPKNPQFKNLLTSYYISTNQEEKAYTLNRKTLELHPNYFFAKLNLANEYINKEEYHKIKEILGENFDLKALYPDRDTFHISEVMSMLKFGVMYHAYLREFEHAESMIERMKKIDEDDFEVENAENLLTQQLFLAAQERNAEEIEKRIDVVTAPQEKTFITEKPSFNHPEIEQLYHYAYDIPLSVLEEILCLPRTSLIEDLVTVLKDGVFRYSFFEENLYEDENSTFVFHAFNLLTELDAKEQLSDVLFVLSQSEELIDFYLSYYLTEYVWMTLFKLGQNQLNVLFDFMTQAGVHTFTKSEVSKAVSQMLLHQLEKRTDVVLWFQAIFETFRDASLDDNLVDSDVIGLMIGDVLDFEGKEMLPVIRELFELDYVSCGICGDLESVEHNFKIVPQRSQQMEYMNLVALYQDINNSFNRNSISNTHFLDDEKESIIKNFSPQTPVINEPKINRNDPCPCGSGKKYKKCCLK